MYHKLEQDLKYWSKQNLSWLGRVNAVKMTLMPRLLYLFRALPIPLRRDHLQSFQNKILKFIWGGSGYRIKQQTLYLSRKQGGLGLPHLHRYYLASRLAQLFVIYREKPDWIRIERQYTLDFLLWSIPKNRPPIMSPTLSHSFTMWDKLKSNPNLSSEMELLSHLFRNPKFPPGLDIKSFQWWFDKGLYCIGQFFTSRGPLSFAQCVSKLDLPQTEQFRFNQINHFLHSI